MINAEKLLIVGLVSLALMGIVSAPTHAQDNSANPGSFGVGATVSVNVERVSTAPTDNGTAQSAAQTQINLLCMAAGFVLGIIITSLFTLLMTELGRHKTITPSNGLRR